MSASPLQITIDKGSLVIIQKWFEKFPRETRDAIRKAWRKEGNRIKKHVQTRVLSGPTGAHSVSMGGYDKATASGRKRLWADIHVNFKASGKKTFGAFLRVGFSGRKKYSAQHIAFFHEYGTGQKGRGAMSGKRGMNLPARSLMATAWESYDQTRITMATDEAINSVTRKF